ncbi:MAG: amidohydrolase [Carnobacterium sp.]|uniref:M20 metallopeptidase family protein n=1 Tax=Carnobacterium sp. TaxID=48221 RepID=UPI002FCC5B3E
MGYNEWEKSLANNFDETVAWRRHLHRYPEISFQETATRTYIFDRLTEFGYEDIRTKVGGGGLVTRLIGAQPGPEIAFRADFDALRIQEETQLPFASVNDGVMHACGHDGHTAILLSVAKVLKQFEAELKGEVVFIFQHAEEVLPGGAKSMIEDGALTDVDYVYGLHLRSPLEYGKVQYCSGFSMAAADFFEITIQGKGGHGSSPHTSIDPIVVGSHLANQLQTLISRTKNPMQAGVLTISTFQAGSEANNVIPDTAYLKGTVRTFEPTLRSLLEEKIKTMAEHICAAYDATCTVTYTKGYPAVYNHPAETEVIKTVFTDKFGAETVETTPLRMGGEDFAYYLEKKPGSFFFVNSGNAEKGIVYPHHHPKFDIDERALLMGGKAFLTIAEHYLAAQTETAIKHKTAIEAAAE